MTNYTKYGTVTTDAGVVITLTQHAYARNHGTDGGVVYIATGIDAAGNVYEVTWLTTADWDQWQVDYAESGYTDMPAGADDESNACDWDCPASIKLIEAAEGLTMTTLNISAHLTDAGRGDHAEESSIFCDSILKHFGSVDAAAAAKAAADAVFAKYEEWPAGDATPAEVSAYEAWETAENAAHKSALAGWARVPDSAHFEVRFLSR